MVVVVVVALGVVVFARAHGDSVVVVVVGGGLCWPLVGRSWPLSLLMLRPIESLLSSSLTLVNFTLHYVKTIKKTNYYQNDLAFCIE